MNDQSLPCRDCITLSMCKAIASQYEFKYISSSANNLTEQILLMNKLTEKCSLIMPYLNPAVQFKEPDLLFHVFDCDHHRIIKTILFLKESSDDILL